MFFKSLLQYFKSPPSKLDAKLLKHIDKVQRTGNRFHLVNNPVKTTEEMIAQNIHRVTLTGKRFTIDVK